MGELLINREVLIMRAKNLAILSFLQAIMITMALVVINIALYRALNWYEFFISNGYIHDHEKILIKLQFYLAVQNNALTLYLIPLCWFFIILFFNNRPQASIFMNKISFWSGIFIMVLFIFITVDAAYLPESVLHCAWYPIDKCSNFDCHLWRYIIDHLSGQ